MDLRGKPSTFSADGTEKLVGEDGLDGGSLVVSMMAVPMDTPCERVYGASFFFFFLFACQCVKRRLGGQEGWGGEDGGEQGERMEEAGGLCESQDGSAID